jgi:hypothetical protein
MNGMTDEFPVFDCLRRPLAGKPSICGCIVATEFPEFFGAGDAMLPGVVFQNFLKVVLDDF